MSTIPTELMAQARSGQTEALGELCALYVNYLRTVARSGMGTRLKLRVDLSDVVQEALCEVVRQFPQFTGDSETSLLRWMRHLMGQKLADLGRYHSRVKRGAGSFPLSLELMLQENSGNHYSLLEGLASNHIGPFEAAVGREQKALLAEALADLPEDEARVLWLYHVDGHSFETIGKRIGRGRKTVRAMWLRGLRKVRREIADACGERVEMSSMSYRARVPLEIPA